MAVAERPVGDRVTLPRRLPPQAPDLSPLTAEIDQVTGCSLYARHAPWFPTVFTLCYNSGRPRESVAEEVAGSAEEGMTKGTVFLTTPQEQQ